MPHPIYAEHQRSTRATQTWCDKTHFQSIKGRCIRIVNVVGQPGNVQISVGVYAIAGTADRRMTCYSYMRERGR